MCFWHEEFTFEHSCVNLLRKFLENSSLAMVGSITHRGLQMWSFECRHACWCCKCVQNLNFNVIDILDLKWPSTMLGTHIDTISTQLCLNAAQCWSQILGTNIETMFTQCCLAIVSMSVPTLGCDIVTMFTYCLNVVSTLFHNVWETMLPQCSHNVAWTLSQL